MFIFMFAFKNKISSDRPGKATPIMKSRLGFFLFIFEGIMWVCKTLHLQREVCFYERISPLFPVFLSPAAPALRRQQEITYCVPA